MPTATLTLKVRLADGSLEVGAGNVSFASPYTLKHPDHRFVVDEDCDLCVEVDADEVEEPYRLAESITVGGVYELEKPVHHGGEQFDVAYVVWLDNPHRAEVVSLRRCLRPANAQEWRDYGPEAALFAEEET